MNLSETVIPQNTLLVFGRGAKSSWVLSCLCTPMELHATGQLLFKTKGSTGLTQELFSKNSNPEVDGENHFRICSGVLCFPMQQSYNKSLLWGIESLDYLSKRMEKHYIFLIEVGLWFQTYFPNNNIFSEMWSFWNGQTHKKWTAVFSHISIPFPCCKH